MRVLVTGAGGYLGGRLCQDLSRKFDVVGTCHNARVDGLVEMDVTNPKRVLEVVRGLHPEVIIHAAANASASWCEQHPEEARALNDAGTKNVVAAANAVGAKLVYVSSIAVARPTTVYARTKLAGEAHAKKTRAGFVILRPSLVIGVSPNAANERTFNKMVARFKAGEEIVCDNHLCFQPVWAGHISEVITAVLERGLMGETIPIAVPEFATRYSLARDLFGSNVRVDEKRDENPSTPASQSALKRLKLPRYSYREVVAKVRREIKGALVKQTKQA